VRFIDEDARAAAIASCLACSTDWEIVRMEKGH
jgi:hypothetical protein